MGQGGEEVLVEAVIDTRLGTSFEHEPFWASVIQYLVRHPMLDPDLIGPIVDYIQAEKYEAQERLLPAGGVERGEPPQPNFSMKSRLPKLLSHVEEWHEQLARDTKVYTGKSWEPSGIGSFDWQYDDPIDDVPTRWTINEIVEGREQVAEGKWMNHCVASYVNNCRWGNTSIWSMQEREKGARLQQVMTIAVQNSTRHISQARRRRNALAKLHGENANKLQAEYKRYLARSRHVLRRWMEHSSVTARRSWLRE